ncbi:MotE family protein [Roseococcus sp. YIM B11640]|uniref:MotE family protein n=1 Tax=Roseococcus sp. YIM B11640 TaxID=3133973 RepID=UPI003C7E6828
MRPRLLPLALLGMLALLGVKIEPFFRLPPRLLPMTAQASATPPAAAPPPAQASSGTPNPSTPISPAYPAPDVVAERAVLESLRARRAELEARATAMAEREMMAEAMERRLAARLEELKVLQTRLEAEARQRDERGEQGWRQLVRLYEGMRPRDAAAIFDDLDMPVLLQVVDRMREAKAAPVLAAMRPERARILTSELARHRARPVD